MNSNWIPEISEKNGLDLLNGNEKQILSIGISTNGNAEIYMAQKCKDAKIIATTIDEQGINKTNKKISNLGLSNRIITKIEDVSKPMPYDNKTFDFIYARLILHYLGKQDLINALTEIKRVLKENGKFYFVVKSAKELGSKEQPISFDENTLLTGIKDPLKENEVRYRQFFTVQNFSKYVKDAGFILHNVKEFEEYTYHDYARTIKAEKPAIMISGYCEINKKEKI